MTSSTPLPEQRGCNVPRCGVWPIYKEGLCGSHYMEKHCPREGGYVSRYDPLPEQGGFNEKLDAVLWAIANHYDPETIDPYPQMTVPEAKTAIRTLVLEEIIDYYPVFHYGCGENDEEFIKGDDPKDLCCECYPHDSCKVRPVVESLQAEQRKRLGVQR